MCCCCRGGGGTQSIFGLTRSEYKILQKVFERQTGKRLSDEVDWDNSYFPDYVYLSHWARKEGYL